MGWSMRDLNYQLKQLCARNKDGSFATKDARERNLSLIATQLRELGFRQMTPHSLKPKHVEALINLWKRDGLATGTIKNRMAHLRWWAEKVGKSSVIPKSNDKLNIERRVYLTNESKARELAPEQLSQITDERIRISLELQFAFGLRTEESLKFRPGIADKGDHIWLKGSWCKGGQQRTVPITNEYQRLVLD
ncbi:MAG TPA: phage integrase N-terminal domain-containing protein, partial [Nitrososphaera sp.]|nr:phage integrase N-terminal domain-containing protein [Nitrososphaera sp.]